jgi:2-polyprenyl-3-methyl-5-hydroxy-6-metoxy-1,4-benzoquinol methylase
LEKLGWTKFWANEGEAFVKIMRLATGVFAERFILKFGPLKGKTILDYGCGPGLLADALEGSESTIAGADINAFFLKEYQRKHPHATLIHLKPDEERADKSLSEKFVNDKFDYIILLSITQYFKDSNALRDTLAILSKFLAHDGKIVLADVVPPNHSAISDGLSLLKYSVRKNYMLEMIMFLRYLFFSAYRTHSSKTPLLQFSKAEIEKICEALGLKCTQESNLTMHKTRVNFILQQG